MIVRALEHRREVDDLLTASTRRGWSSPLIVLLSVSVVFELHLRLIYDER